MIALLCGWMPVNNKWSKSLSLKTNLLETIDVLKGNTWDQENMCKIGKGMVLPQFSWNLYKQTIFSIRKFQPKIVKNYSEAKKVASCVSIWDIDSESIIELMLN